MFNVTITNSGIDTLIHGQNVKLSSGKIVRGINSIDSFTFTMLPNNPGISLLHEFTTIVKVHNERKDRDEFVGRVLYTEDEMTENGNISKMVTCESLLGYLCDSQQMYVAEKNWTVSELLTHLIACHNSQVEEHKQFKVGTITVKDSNDNLYLGVQRENTWDALNTRLIEKIGGEFQYRIEEDGLYLDYLSEIGETKETEIALSYNMKAITREKDPSSFVTRLIPLGAKLGEDTEERLDITSVNGGKNYIDDADLIAVYGIHVGIQEWDDVKTATALLTKGRKWLTANNRVQVKYSITALDLSRIGLAYDDFVIGNYHPIKNVLLKIDDTARIIKQTIDVCNEVDSVFEVGDNFKTLSELQIEAQKAQAQNIAILEKTTQNLGSGVSQTQKDLNALVERVDNIAGVFFYIRYSAFADGTDMTEKPQSNTAYMGTCSTNSTTAPEDKGAYTWCRIIGADGATGSVGVGIDTITEEYYHSTSATSLVGGSWSTTAPIWVDGKYIWTRSIISYTDGSSLETSPICVSGSKGETGSQGIQGEKGEKGDRGEQGIQGVQGEKGEKGDTGEKGDQGEQGIQGIQGVQGEKGDTGEQGEKGDKGDKGDTGAQGVQGEKGDTGAQGIQGEKGEKGDKGETGATGVGVSSVDVLYYKSTSATSLSGGSWVTTNPGWENGKYIWTKTKVTYTNGSTEESTAVCITGAKGDTGATGATGAQGATGATGATGNGISSIVEQYYSSTSATSLTGGSWSTTYPGWVDGKYIWTRSVITYTNGTSETTTAVCVTGSKGATGAQGAKGDTGAQGAKGDKGDTGATGAQGAKGDKGDTGATGNGVSSIVTQFYLSTSKTTQTGGSWVTSMPTWSSGTYLWTRSKITYTNGSTAYTSPQCDSAWEAATALDNKLNQTEVFNRLTNNGALQGLYMLNGQLYINASYIKTGELLADLIKAGVIKSKDGTSLVIDLDNGTADLTGNITTESITEDGIKTYSQIRTDAIGTYKYNEDGELVARSAMLNGLLWLSDDTAGYVDFISATVRSSSVVDGLNIKEFLAASSSSVYKVFAAPGQAEVLKIFASPTENYVSGLTTPTGASHATNKAYVDAADKTLTLTGTNIAWDGTDWGMGTRQYYYEGADTAALNLPYPHVVVIVSKQRGGNRGIAMAYQWANGYRIWMNRLHNDGSGTWSGWEYVGCGGHNTLASQGSKTSGNAWSLSTTTLKDYKNLLFTLKDNYNRVSLTSIPISLISTTSTVYGLNPLFGGGGDTHKGWGDVTIVKSGTTVRITYNTRMQDAVSISNCTLYLER